MDTAKTKPQGVVVFAKDIVEANGKTVEENNLAIKHKFNVGDHVKCIPWEGSDVPAGNYFIASCDRDCDGEVLYSISTVNKPELFRLFRDKYEKVLLGLALNKDKTLEYIDFNMSQKECEQMLEAITTFTNKYHTGMPEAYFEYVLDEQ